METAVTQAHSVEAAVDTVETFGKLTDAEWKVLMVLQNPENRKLSSRKLAEKAGVSHTFVLQCRGNKRFAAAYMKLRAGRILDALADKAEEGEFQHARLALEIAGLYEPKGNQVVNAIQVNGGEANILSGMTTAEKVEQLRSLLAALEAKQQATPVQAQASEQAGEG